jgi:hypothetical protein
MKYPLFLAALLPLFATCSSLAASGPSPKTSFAATTSSQNLLPITGAFGYVRWCSTPKDINCLRLNIYYVRIGGSMTPSSDFQMVFQGEKALESKFGNSFGFTFPSSGFSKFMVNNIFLTLEGDLDKNLINRTSTCTLDSSEVDQAGVYSFVYGCK